MGIGYKKVPAKVDKVVNSVLKEYHSELHDIETTVLCLFANNNGSGVAPALTKGGQSCAAMIRQTTIVERVAGMADALILIDEPQWKSLNDNGRKALIDHELEHLVVKYKKKSGSVCYDESGRPIFSMKRHDYEIGVFTDIIERYGIAAIDCQNVRKLVECREVQLHFESIQGNTQKVRENVAADEDMAALVERAIVVISETHRATRGGLQRRLSITHTKADKLMEVLEEKGIVGPPNGAEPREILIKLSETAVA